MLNADSYIDDEGAYTGEISPWMLAEESIPWVILGHSERRSIFKESEDHIAEKTVAALKNKLKVIFCVGEKLEEREADKTLEVVESQLEELRKAKVDWRCAYALSSLFRGAVPAPRDQWLFTLDLLTRIQRHRHRVRARLGHRCARLEPVAD